MMILLALTMIFLLQQTAKADDVALIFVYDETGTPKSLILGAIGEADFVLRLSGVRTRWQLCGSWETSRCSRVPRRPNQISITITNREDGASSKRALGFALPFTEQADTAAAILPRIMKFAQGERTALRNVLGAVMAHEIGHLLLRSDTHGDGIMSANWELPELRRMATRTLLFTKTQAHALQEGLRQRLAN
jgi:hypothetical protein